MVVVSQTETRNNVTKRRKRKKWWVGGERDKCGEKAGSQCRGPTGEKTNWGRREKGTAVQGLTHGRQICRRQRKSEFARPARGGRKLDTGADQESRKNRV